MPSLVILDLRQVTTVDETSASRLAEIIEDSGATRVAVVPGPAPVQEALSKARVLAAVEVVDDPASAAQDDSAT